MKPTDTIANRYQSRGFRTKTDIRVQLATSNDSIRAEYRINKIQTKGLSTPDAIVPSAIAEFDSTMAVLRKALEDELRGKI